IEPGWKAYRFVRRPLGPHPRARFTAPSRSRSGGKMKLRLVVALALVGVVGIAGCRRSAPEAAPAPIAADDDAAARARADSIAAAELARRQAEERELRAQMARAQEVLSNVVHFEYDSFQLDSAAEDR